MTPSEALDVTKSTERGASAVTTERGASPISIVMIVVVVLMFLEFVVVGGRFAAAGADVTAATRESARQASLAQSAYRLDDLLDQTMNANLIERGHHCVARTATSAGTDFRPGGRVQAKVSCAIDLSDFSFLEMPWPTWTFSAEAVEVIETYRAVD